MQATPSTRADTLAAIGLGGFVAGTIDIGAACLITGFAPTKILKIVAGGLLGRAAFDGDASIAALGMLLQWAMSLVIAAVFVLAARRLPSLLRHWVVAGLLYGVVVYFVMNDIVVPLSALGHGTLPKFDLVPFVENMLAMLLFGLIVAFYARRRLALRAPE